MDTFIFPLNTVLYPGGLLPLRIFEQRYIEMTKICISESRPFGVCLIKEGRETGTPAIPERIGCLANITQWDMPQLGVFQLKTEGTQRFRIIDSSTAKNGLTSADIEMLPQDAEAQPENRLCVDMLTQIMEKVGSAHFPAPRRMDDAAWIGYRLCEVLPIAMNVKQSLLELTDPQARLTRLSDILSRNELQS